MQLPARSRITYWRAWRTKSTSFKSFPADIVSTLTLISPFDALASRSPGQLFTVYLAISLTQPLQSPYRPMTDTGSPCVGKPAVSKLSSAENGHQLILFEMPKLLIRPDPEFAR